jgi:hypothetical protein
MFPKLAGSRRFDWHPDAQPDQRKLKHENPALWAVLVQRIRSLAAPGGDRWTRSGVGRVMYSPILEPPGLFLLYVERRDENSLGGLVLHRSSESSASNSLGPQDKPPDGAFELAQARLAEKPAW